MTNERDNGYSDELSIRPAYEVVAVANDLGRIFDSLPVTVKNTEAFQFIRGEVEVLNGAVVSDEQIRVKTKDSLVHELEIIEDQLFTVREGTELVDGQSISYLDGRKIGLEWLLGIRETLDHGSDRANPEEPIH